MEQRKTRLLIYIMKANYIYILLILTSFTFHFSNAQTALEFDGLDDYVYISYEPSYTPDSSLTIETSTF